MGSLLDPCVTAGGSSHVELTLMYGSKLLYLRIWYDLCIFSVLLLEHDLPCYNLYACMIKSMQER